MLEMKPLDSTASTTSAEQSWSSKPPGLQKSVSADRTLVKKQVPISRTASPTPTAMQSSNSQPVLSNSHSKYPAIAIKPKPVPIAVLPKPTTTAKSNQTAPFDMSQSSSLKTEISLNINTSRKWVLPPRPRPGRKPISQPISTPATATTPSRVSPPPANEKNKPSPKKRGKTIVKKEPEDILKKVTSPNYSDTASPVSSVSSPAFTSTPATTLHSPALITPKVLDQKPPSPPKIAVKDEKLKTNEKLKKDETLGLQSTYLAKLKEQDLIRNYIEVIDNQIKELKFVESGVITFDALNSIGKLQPSQPQVQEAKPSKTASYEQLEKINNMNDLNKFIAYLTRSTNIIHSVTKRFMGVGLNKNGAGTEQSLQEQINHYLDIRSKYKLLKTQELKSLEKLKRERARHNKRENKDRELSPTSVLLSPDKPINGNIALPFGSSLLRPLNQNLFDNGDDFTESSGLDTIEYDSGILTQSPSLLNSLADFKEDLNFGIEGNEMFLDLESPQPEAPVMKTVDSPQVALNPNTSTSKEKAEKKKKFNCGFCTNDTPCLCFDAETF